MATIFSYTTYTISREFTNYDDSEDEEYYEEDYFENDDFSLKEINQLNKLDKKITSGKTGQVIPTTNKDYQAAVAYKKAKRLAYKQSTSPSDESTLTTQKLSSSESEEDNSQDEDSNKTKKLSKTEVNSIIEAEIKDTKKKRLPSSVEVYNRILHDEKLQDKICDFVIFYEDRFDGICECEFLKFDHAIPYHRIRKFRYLNNVVWSRSDRFYDFSSLLIDNN